MGFLEDVRNRFFPPSNRVYLRLTDATNSEVAALRREVSQLSKKVDRLVTDQVQRQKVLLSTMDCLMLTMSKRAQGKRTILLAGWYCAGNTGDELMLKTLVNYAPLSIRDDIYVLAWNDNPEFDPEALNDLGVHVVHYPGSIREIDMLATCFDVLVWGGGAILDDVQYDSRQNNCNTGNLFIRLSEIMIASEKSVYAIGLSTNDEFSSKEYLARLQRIIDGSELFTLRDQISYEVLREAGIKMDNVGRCEDIAFASPAVMDPTPRCASDGKVLGFVPFHIPGMQEVNIAVLDDALSLVADDPEARVLLIPFYSNADARYLPRLRDACSNPDRVEIAPFADDIANSPVFGCDHLIVSRYHAALIASAASIPYVCVVPDMHRHYKNKLRHLSTLSGYEDHYLLASEWVEGERGKELLTRLLTEVEGPHLPENVGSDTREMIVGTWKRIGETCI